MKPVDYLKQRLGDDWLIGDDSSEFFALTQNLIRELETRSPKPIILLVERHPLKFLAHFMAACAANCSIFLGNPDWAKAEWQQVFELVQPNLIVGELESYQFSTTGNSISLSSDSLPFETPLIMIPTGGSSGKVRFAMHTWETLMASVQGFQQYFGVDCVNSFCVLPLYHVSGLMQFLRSFTSGGQLVVLPFKAVESGQQSNITPEKFFLSLVPTQLQRLLNQPQQIEWLTRFQTVLLGGAPAWTELLHAARNHAIRLAPTYGMTETASQIATLKPNDFLAGNLSCGRVLPHAQVSLCNSCGELEPDRIGTLTISANSLALGYYPDRFQKAGTFQPDDLGYLDQQGYLHIVGRSSDKIITGGENVFPSEVEAAIRSTGLVKDVCVLGVPDPHWGQAVTAIYVPTNRTVESTLQASVASLCKFKRPKHWIAIDQLPRNPQGKVNRQQVKELLTSLQLPTVATTEPPVPKSFAESESQDQYKHDEFLLD